MNRFENYDRFIFHQGIPLQFNWTQQIYYGRVHFSIGYFSCITITSETPLATNSIVHLLFGYDEVTFFRSKGQPYIEAYIHDPKEPYSSFLMFNGIRTYVHGGSMVELSLSTQVMEFQDKPLASCDTDPNYSYVKVSSAGMHVNVSESAMQLCSTAVTSKCTLSPYDYSPSGKISFPTLTILGVTEDSSTAERVNCMFFVRLGGN